MNRAPLPLLASLAFASCAAAAPDRPPVDREAMEEAIGAGRIEGYASARAYLHYIEARLAEHRGDAARAIEEMRLAAVYDPSSADVRIALGWLLARVDALDRAEVEARRALALAPDHPGALGLLGYIWAHRGVHLDEALPLLERAVELRPDDGASADSLGWLLLQRGEADRAVKLLERADALSPGDPVILDHLAEAYARLGRPGEAVRAWSRALRLLEDDPRPRIREGIEAKLRRVTSATRHQAAGFDFEEGGR